MISFISKGRLANFAFVAMSAYCYSLKHGLEFHVQDKSLAPHLWPLYFQHLKNPIWNPNLETVYVNDNQHHYRELEFDESWRDKNIMIGTTDINSGYFQSHRYISGYEAQIRKTFLLEGEPKKGICSCHVRRGDYLQYSDKHPPITEEYLEDAMRKLIKKTGVKYFHIFSDDIKYCKDVFPTIFTKLYNDFGIIGGAFSDGNDEITDFREMLLCEHNIVANSSFSVLAAILNPNPDKVVICPHEDNYFGHNNRHLSVKDLYPPDWIRIKYQNLYE